MASRNELQCWTIVQSSDACSFHPWTRDVLNLKAEPAVCVRLSEQSEFCAVGFNRGLIQLFRLDHRRPVLVHELLSHTATIHALLFSPWTSQTGKPVILASVSEQLCFWNVTFAVNNPVIDQRDSYSHRFSDRSPRSPQVKHHFDIRDHHEVCPWIGKLGPTGKEELLVCYKFNGNAAKQIFTNATFTQFLTIDDFGEIYFLKVPDPEESDPENVSGVDEVFLQFETINMNSIS